MARIQSACGSRFEGVIWRFKTGGQRREMPQAFGAWPTVSNRFRRWPDASVFAALAPVWQAGSPG